MKRIVFIPLVLILVVFSAIAFPRAAHADNPPGYDIEVQMVRCLNSGQPCTTPATIRNSEYIQVEAVSFHPGATHGTPDAVDFTCGSAYVDDDGVFHDVAEHVFAGYEPGTIKGNAALEGNYTESITHAEGSMWVHAVDNVTGDSGTAWGEMSTNNVTDLRTGGGFHLVLNGPIYDESHPANGPGVTEVVGHGKVTCEAYSPYVFAPFASGPYFEAVLGNTDGD